MNFVNMAMTPEQKQEYASPALAVPSTPTYPYGLSLCLQDDQLNKLNLDANCGVGDVLHMVCIARVTSVSQNETEGGMKSRVELQITDIALPDTGMDELEEAPRPRINLGKFYKSE